MRAFAGQIPLRQKRKNGCPNNVMLPVQTSWQKYFCSQHPQITCISIAVSLPQRGTARDRHGRWERDAVDANGALDETRQRGRRSRVVLTPRRWRQVGGRNLPPATVANKPGHRGEREGNR